jgi:hypothetical protein
MSDHVAASGRVDTVTPASPGERCPARVKLGDVQVAWLNERPNGANMAEPATTAISKPGTAGLTPTSGQPGTETEWWVYWTLSASEILEVNGCPVVRPEPDQRGEQVLCLLFENHPGRHSYELNPGSRACLLARACQDPVPNGWRA